MEQPVTPIGSHSDFAPQQALLLSRQEEQQSDSSLSWQVGEHTRDSWQHEVHEKICGRLELLWEQEEGVTTLWGFGQVLVWGLFFHAMRLNEGKMAVKYS